MSNAPKDVPPSQPELNEPHCATCICGKRAHVQAEGGHGPGTVTWAEHQAAWSFYAAKYGRGQSAERINERGGFGYLEIQDLLGHAPKTWSPRGVQS